MSKKQYVSLSWPIYFPILFVLGIVVAVWGGIFVSDQVKKGAIQEEVLQTEEYVRQFSKNWGEVEGQLNIFNKELQQQNSLRQTTLTENTKKLLEQTGYTISAVAFFERQGQSYNLLYSQGLLSDIENTALQTGEGLHKALEGIPFTPENKGFTLFTFPLLKTNAQHVWQSIWAVSPAFYDGKRTFLITKINTEKLLSTVLNKKIKAENSFFSVRLLEDIYLHKGLTKEPDYVREIPFLNTVLTTGWRYLGVHKKSYIAGVFFALVVLVIMAVVFWSFWMQHSVTQRVRKEVISRTKELEQAGRKFRLITDNAYDLIAIFTVSGGFEYINSAYNRVLGYALKALAGRQFLDFIHEDERAYVKEALQAVVDGRPVSEVNFRIKAKNGTWVHMEAVAKGVFDNSWNLTSIVLHSRDVTASKRYADQLARSEQRFKDFADSSADWLWEISQNYEFTYVSPGVKTTLGHLPQDMIGRNIFEALFAKHDDATRDLIEELSERHQPYREVEFWTRTRTGERVCLRLSGVPIFDSFGHFSGYRGAATNITSSKVDSENMLRLATTDHLTGLLNRSRFMEELENTIELAQQHGTQGVVLFLDLDRFKAVNDTHGHTAGDIVIKSIAALLRRSVRSTDVISRLAGDEFAIIMHNIDEAMARQKIQSLIRKISQTPIEYREARLQLTVSVGMVSYPQQGKDASQLLTSADLAMYRAKDLGRNRLYMDEEVTDSDKASATVREQLEWLDRLRVAIAQDSFEMHFQPIVPCCAKSDVIYESLIRLRDEHGKLGAPGLFIDAAEHFGMIRELDKAVVSRCIRVQTEMETKGFSPTLSVNLSGVSFSDHELLHHMQAEFARYKANPKKFVFEVTETAAMRDIDQARSFVSVLKEMGSKFALDDFGVGFSSFFYIKHLEVDYIKIDGSYIKHLDESREDRLFVKSLVDLASGLNIQTVAEFVENEAILDELVKMDVTYAQGYHLSRPEEDLTALYKKFNGKLAQEHGCIEQKPKVIKLRTKID